MASPSSYSPVKRRATSCSSSTRSTRRSSSSTSEMRSPSSSASSSNSSESERLHAGPPEDRSFPAPWRSGPRAPCPLLVVPEARTAHLLAQLGRLLPQPLDVEERLEFREALLELRGLFASARTLSRRASLRHQPLVLRRVLEPALLVLLPATHGTVVASDPSPPSSWGLCRSFGSFHRCRRAAASPPRAA